VYRPPWQLHKPISRKVGVVGQSSDALVANSDHQIHQLNHLVSRTLFHLMPSHWRLPQETHAVVMKQSAPDRIPLRHDAVLTIKPIPSSKDGQALVEMTVAEFSHREVSIYAY
jgi:hypothetical protein